MKKILYYVSLFIIATFLTFCFNKNVLAACEDLSTNECRVTSRGEIIVSGNNSKYRELWKATLNENKYTATYKYSSVGITYSKATASDPTFYAYDDGYSAVYCFDPQLPGIDPLRAGRFLLDTSESPKIQILDYALLSILTNNGSDMLYNAQAHNSKDYWARLLALRAIIYTFGEYNSADETYKGYYYASLTMLNEWLKDSTISDLHKKLGDKLAELKQNSLKEKSAFTKNLNYKFSGDESLNRAKQYYINALKEAIEYAEKLTSSKNVKIETSSYQNDISTSTYRNYTTVSTTAVHTIKVSGLSKGSTDSFIIKGLNFSKEYTGLTYNISKIKIGTKSYTSSSDIRNILNKNLLNVSTYNRYFNFEGETVIEITISFSGYKTSRYSSYTLLKCSEQPMGYYIDGTYSKGDSNKYSGYVGTIWYTGPGQQRYIGIEKASTVADSSIRIWRSDSTAKLIEECGCDELEESCKLGDTEACKEYNVLCAKCNTTVDTFECCIENEEGLLVTTLDDHKVKINGPKDAKLCFVDQVDALRDKESNYNNANAVDDKGNSYTMMANKYCTVSCKEDYVMTMPGAKLVNAGRYFTFKAHIKGTKTCYTNTIDKDQFNEDIIEAQKKLIDAYNDYIKYQSAQEEIDNGAIEEQKKVNRCNSYCGDTYTNYYLDVDSVGYNYRKGTNNQLIVTENKSINYYKSATGSRGSSSCCYQSCPADATDCKSGCTCDRHCSRSCYSGNSENIINDVRNKLQTAKTKLQTAQKSLDDIINSYNACSTWTSEVKFIEDDDIYYDYEEDYLYGKKGEMTSYDTSRTTDDDWYCSGDISDTNYETCTAPEKYNRDSTLQTKQYFYCTTSGCSLKDYKISNANYVRKTSTMSKTYKPKTLFYNIYSNGKITDTSSSKNVSLNNSLPVSVNTPRGIYEYVINITNLGEFYKTKTLGRLIGSSTAVIDKNKVEYVCAYLVNFADNDYEKILCDWDNCKNGDCSTNCIGPNCKGCYGKDCVSTCIGTGCLYEEGNGLSVYERMVSLNKLFPRGTSSYNWDASKNAKAQETIKEIEDKGNEIYNDTPIFSITIDATDAAQIRKYNDIAEKDNNGGYSNDTLDCRSLKVGSKTYAETACFSTFITDLINGKIVDDDEGNKGNIDVKLNSSKIKDINKYREVKNITSSDSGYFTGWNFVPDDRTGPGPSWK